MRFLVPDVNEAGPAEAAPGDSAQEDVDPELLEYHFAAEEGADDSDGEDPPVLAGGFSDSESELSDHPDDLGELLVAGFSDDDLSDDGLYDDASVGGGPLVLGSPPWRAEDMIDELFVSDFSDDESVNAPQGRLVSLRHFSASSSSDEEE